MPDITPSFYSLKNKPNINGVAAGDVNIAMYNLYLALYALCNNIDVDAGTIGSNYASVVSTPLLAAGSGSMYPLGALDSTVSKFYTPSEVMKPGGVLQADVFTAMYDLGLAIDLICKKLDADAGSSLDTNFRATVSTPLTASLGSKLGAPDEGLITSTYFYGMESFMANGCFTQGDLYKCLYDFYIAIVRICTLFDAGSGTLPQTLMTNVGTPLNTAVGQYIVAPSGA